MNLKRIPAAFALGLPAALLGHAFLFGSEHEVGGQQHVLLIAIASAFSLGVLTFFAALAWRGGRASVGSVLAARLSDCMPGFASIFAAAFVYFRLCESFEQTHAAKALPLSAALLLLASWLVCELARIAIRIIAEAVVTITRLEFAPRAPQWSMFATPQFVCIANPSTRRRFARPPPASPARI